MLVSKNSLQYSHFSVPDFKQIFSKWPDDFLVTLLIMTDIQPKDFEEKCKCINMSDTNINLKSCYKNITHNTQKN